MNFPYYCNTIYLIIIMSASCRCRNVFHQIPKGCAYFPWAVTLIGDYMFLTGLIRLATVWSPLMDELKVVPVYQLVSILLPLVERELFSLVWLAILLHVIVVKLQRLWILWGTNEQTVWCRTVSQSVGYVAVIARL